MQEDAMFQMREVLTCLLSSGLLALSAYIVASVIYEIQRVKVKIEELRGMKEDMELRLESEYSQEFLQTFDGEQGIKAKLNEMLENAKNEVLIICPRVSEEGTISKIERLQVPVKTLLLDPDAQEDLIKKRRDVKIAERLGKKAEVLYHNSLHAKVLLVDREAMLLGSANFTQSGLEESLESAIYTEDPVLLRDALRFFDALWEAHS